MCGGSEERRVKRDAVGVDVLDDPREFRLQIAHPSVAKKRDLQKPSLVREGGPLAVDE